MYTANKIKTFRPAHGQGYEPSQRHLILCLLITALFCLTAASNTASAATYTYYVDTNNPNAGDGNPGTTEALPWKTLTKAANTAQAGDTVLVKAGIYNESLRPLNSGTAGAMITFKAYPGANAVIDATGLDYVVDLTGRNYIRIEGFQIRNSNFYGVYIPLTSNHIGIEIVSNEIYRTCKGFGKSLGGAITVHKATDLLIQDNDIHHNEGGSAIWIEPDIINPHIIGNYIHHNPDGIQGGGGSNWIIEDNIIGDQYDLMGRGDHFDNIQIQRGNLNGLIIRNNIIWDATQNIYVANHIYGVIENVEIYGNVIYNDDCGGPPCAYRKGIFLEGRTSPLGYVRNVEIYDNTIYNMFYGVLAGINVEGNITMRNNLIFNCDSLIDFGSGVPATVDSDYNLLYNGNIAWRGVWYTSLTQFQQATGLELNSIDADPEFVDPSSFDFHLKPTSPAINAGDPELATSFTLPDPLLDLDGNPRPDGAGYDIGAYEYVASDPNNQAPILEEIGDKSVNENSLLTFDVNATDPNGDTITYSATGLPSGATFVGQSFSWTPSYEQAGTYQVTFIARDTHYAQDSETITITVNNVNRAPVLASIGPKSGDEGLLIGFTASASDSDVPANSLTFSLINAPAGASIDPVTGYFTWIPTEAQGPDSYDVTVRVTDDGAGNLYDEEVVTITVNEVNASPTLSAIDSKFVDEGAQLTFTASASDTDVPGDTLTFSLINAPVGASINPVTGVFTWTPAESQGPDSYDVTVRVTDNGVGSLYDQEAINITVNEINVAPVLGPIDDQTMDVGSQLTFTANATDADVPANGLTFSLSNAPAGASIDPVTGYFTWIPTEAQGPDSYDVTVRVTDDGAGNLYDEESMTITIVPDETDPTVTNLSPAADSIQAPLNTLVILDITDSGDGVDANSVTVKVNNNIVYTGNTNHYPSADGDCRRLGTKADYKFIYHQWKQNFDFDQPINITVNATDLAGNIMDEYSYSFKSEMRSFGENKILSSGSSNDNWGPLTTVSDSSGNIWVAWPQGVVGSRDIYIGKLTVGTDSFVSSGVVQVTNDSNDQGNPVLAVDGVDKLYLAWQDNRQGEWDIYISTSDDWSTQTKITDPNSNQINPAIAVDSTDKVYVVWEDDQNSDKDIYIASSTNSFSTQVTTRITSAIYDQITPDIAVGYGDIADLFDDTVYVVWADARSWDGNGNPKYDLYGAASDNSWTNILIVTENDQQSSPKIATEAVGSVLHLVWLDDTNGDDDIYYATSDGLPASPLTGSSIIDPCEPGADQISPVIITTGYTGNDLRVFACWRDERNKDVDLYAVEIGAGAGTNVFVGDDDTSTDQSEPAIGIDEYGHPYLVWINERTDICYAGSTFIEPVVLASSTASVSSKTTVGTVPGSITNIDDVSAEVPQGAYLCDVKVTISRIRNPHKPPSNNRTFLYEFGPSGTTFSEPVTITIPYNATTLVSSPSAYWYNPLTGLYSQEGITDVEVIQISSGLYALRFKTTHFSIFGGGGPFGGGGGGGGCSMSPNNQGSIVEFLLPYIGLTVVMTILKLRDRRKNKMHDITKSEC